jgi:hypothetical protein
MSAVFSQEVSMRVLAGLLVAGGALVASQVQAQDLSTVPPAVPTAAAVSVPATSGEITSSTTQIDDVQRMLAVMYADLERMKARESSGLGRIITVGSGAGAGYLVGGIVAGAVVAPVIAGAVTTVGFTPAVSAGAASAIETMGAFSGAYGGALAADDLID